MLDREVSGPWFGNTKEHLPLISSLFTGRWWYWLIFRDFLKGLEYSSGWRVVSTPFYVTQTVTVNHSFFNCWCVIKNHHAETHPVCLLGEGYCTQANTSFSIGRPHSHHSTCWHVPTPQMVGSLFCHPEHSATHSSLKIQVWFVWAGKGWSLLEEIIIKMELEPSKWTHLHIS